MGMMKEKGCRLLQDFILPALRKGTFGDHLIWDPTNPGVFMLKWIHKAKSSWSVSDATVFIAWDRIKGRPVAKTPSEFVNSKQRLRAALRNVKTVEEVESDSCGYRKYRILDMSDLPLTQRLNGGYKKVKEEFSEKKTNLKFENENKPLIKQEKINYENEKKPLIKQEKIHFENEKKPLIKQEKIEFVNENKPSIQEKIKLEDNMKPRSRTTLFSGNKRQNKEKDYYNDGRVITRSLRAKKLVKYEESDDDDDENIFQYKNINVLNSNDSKLAMKKRPIGKMCDSKTHSHNYNKRISEEHDSARKVEEDWHLQDTYVNYENHRTKKAKFEPTFYCRSLMKIAREKINTRISYSDEAVGRKQTDKNEYHVRLMDIEKGMNEIALYHKVDSVEEKMKIDEAFYYNQNMTDKVTEKSKIDYGMSTNVGWEDDHIQNMKKEQYDPYAHLPWTYTILEEKYRIPPVTEQLPDKIFESDSDDEKIAFSEQEKKNVDCNYLCSNDILQGEDISTTAKIITNEELLKIYITEDASHTLKQENTNNIDEELEIIDEFIKSKLKCSKEKYEVTLTEPRMYSGFLTVDNASNTSYQKTFSTVQYVETPDDFKSLDDKYFTDLMAMDLEMFYQRPPFN